MNKEKEPQRRCIRCRKILVGPGGPGSYWKLYKVTETTGEVSWDQARKLAKEIPLAEQTFIGFICEDCRIATSGQYDWHSAAQEEEDPPCSSR